MLNTGFYDVALRKAAERRKEEELERETSEKRLAEMKLRLQLKEHDEKWSFVLDS